MGSGRRHLDILHSIPPVQAREQALRVRWRAAPAPSLVAGCARAEPRRWTAASLLPCRLLRKAAWPPGASLPTSFRRRLLPSCLSPFPPSCSSRPLVCILLILTTPFPRRVPLPRFPVLTQLSDPLAEFFPFITKPTLGWKELLRRPSLWASPLGSVSDLALEWLRDKDEDKPASS